MRTLILIPTYNEKDNIAPLIQAIVAAYDASSVKAKAELSILVIDDNSPDGTADVVRGLNHPRVNLLSRPGKQGLGKAYLAGFDWGLKQGYDALIEMDADFSHRPVDLMRLIQALLDGADFAVGSRYVEGGGTQNWGLMRKVISRGGSLYSRTILGHPLGDWTGGFNAWKKETLKGMGLERVRSEGYSFQIELKYRALEAGFKGVEVPILFEDRRVGQSKMSAKIVFEAFGRVWGMRFG
ncbi:MAG: polyprenol monophosphomannose synthase [Bdellovibrionaceae bacterium]|nr:polyprenol monophosphomannose synthase [Pseudobdellovibrionaceae bacterium]